MYKQNSLVHIVQENDTIYLLSRRYSTTVKAILDSNPGVNPYNLQSGQRLTIFPGPGYNAAPARPTRPAPVPPPMPSPPSQQAPPSRPPIVEPMPMPTVPPVRPPVEPVPMPTIPPVAPRPPVHPAPMPTLPPINSGCPRQLLMGNMRRLMLQKAYWMRMNMVGILDRSTDWVEVTSRFQQIPRQFGDIFDTYYGVDQGNEIAALLLEQQNLTIRMLKDLQAGNTHEAGQGTSEWQVANANIGKALAALNPHMDAKQLSDMLLHNQELLSQQAQARMLGRHREEHEAFCRHEELLENLADYMSESIASHVGI